MPRRPCSSRKTGGPFLITPRSPPNSSAISNSACRWRQRRAMCSLPADTAQIVLDWSIDGTGPDGKHVHLGGSAMTLTDYVRDYQEGGIEALKILAFRRPRSDLEDHRATLESYFREHPPASVKEAMATIEKLTGVKRSPERVRAFLKRMGMKCRKVGMIPAKADIDAQEDFKKNSSSHVWKRPRPGNAWSFSSMPRTSS